MNDPIHLQIGNEELSINSDIEHNIEIVSEKYKWIRFLEILQEKIIKNSKILIFCMTKKKVDEIN